MISLALLAALVLPQEPGDLAAVRQTQAVRTKIVAKVMPSVCSVMALESPGGGSGVIVDPMGFVVSNFHVVRKRGKKKKARLKGAEPAEKKKFDPAHKVMKIGLPDGQLYLADVLGVDPGSDLAILLIRPKNGQPPFPYSPLGDSDELLVGETVFAMGNPFLLATDFTPTLTWGIVSGTHRYQSGQGNRVLVYPDCIQVDAPVNPGNSGGPLFNEKGEVVGINGRITIRDRGRVNTGVGFAIASNQIRNFLADMMAGRHAEHGTLDLNAWYMKAPGETRPEVVVQSTFSDSYAAKLGVELGDQLTEFNGDPIKSANQLATLVGVLPADSWVTIGYRPHRENGGFAAERRITFKLRKLDTGSTRYEKTRIAPEEKRKIARVAMTRKIGMDQDKVAGATVVFTSPTGEKIRIERLGDKLRWSDGILTLVRTGADEGFKVFQGRASKISVEEQSKLEREFRLNPWLWRGVDLRNKLKDSTLEGGLQAPTGKPACRYRVPGPSEFEMFFLLDGTPAGYRYRDQLRKQLIDVLVYGDEVWFIADKKTLTRDWKMTVSHDPLPEAKLFERPAQ